LITGQLSGCKSPQYLKSEFTVPEGHLGAGAERENTLFLFAVVDAARHGRHGDRLLSPPGQVQAPLVVEVELARVEDEQIADLLLIHLHLKPNMEA